MPSIDFLVILLTLVIVMISLRAVYKKFKAKDTRTPLHAAETNLVLPYVAQTALDPVLHNHATNTEFETFIIEKFPRPHFELLEWRSDKIHRGIYPLSNKSPDLIYSYNDLAINRKFSIVCSWHQGFTNGAIDWEKNYQMENYINFQVEKGIKIFIAVGIGGDPHKPDELYVLPIDSIASKNDLLSKQCLHPFKHQNTEAPFVLNVHSMCFYQ